MREKNGQASHASQAIASENRATHRTFPASALGGKQASERSILGRHCVDVSFEAIRKHVARYDCAAKLLRQSSCRLVPIIHVRFDSAPAQYFLCPSDRSPRCLFGVTVATCALHYPPSQFVPRPTPGQTIPHPPTMALLACSTTDHMPKPRSVQ